MMNKRELEYLQEFGERYIIKVKSAYFQSWGYPNTFNKDWMMAMQYKNIKTVSSAIKRLKEMHGGEFTEVQIKNAMGATL